MMKYSITGRHQTVPRQPSFVYPHPHPNEKKNPTKLLPSPYIDARQRLKSKKTSEREGKNCFFHPTLSGNSKEMRERDPRNIIKSTRGFIRVGNKVGNEKTSKQKQKKKDE